MKRILQELKEIQKDDNPDILAEALEENIFEWHFVIRGAWDTEFEGGIYHGRILMPAEYPFKPPAFVMLTPSGRFETGTKICLSISSFHPESWQPSWSVRSALVALIAFMQTPGNGAVGSIDTATDIRKQMAIEARTTPPKHANCDVQELINAQHQNMLDLEEESKNLYSRGGSPKAAQAESRGMELAEGEASVVVPAGTPSEEAVIGSDEEEKGKVMFQPQETTPSVTPSSSSLEAAITTPPLFQPQQKEDMAATPTGYGASSSEGREPFLRQPTPSPPLSPSLAVPAATTTTTSPSSTSWEDKGLSFVAVLLGAILLAVVLRRMVLAFAPTGGRGSSSDPLLFSVNPSADFDFEL